MNSFVNVHYLEQLLRRDSSMVIPYQKQFVKTQCRHVYVLFEACELIRILVLDVEQQ